MPSLERILSVNSESWEAKLLSVLDTVFELGPAVGLRSTVYQLKSGR